MGACPDLISVVVCTYNRSHSLQEALGALRAQRLEGADYEVVVVDNNSTDDTRDVVERAQPSFPCRLRYLFECRQGLSYARNAGVAAARGDVVAFTDDDVEVDRRWLASLLDAFERFDADCVYGKILPRWLGEKPPWLGPRLSNNLALLDHGEQPFVVRSEAHRFFGANFAVRQAALRSAGLFDVRLGRRGTALGGGEETALFLRLLGEGRTIVYQPAAVVFHNIPPERMTKRYFRQWHFADGRSWARATPMDGARAVCGIPLWTVRKCLGAAGTSLRSAWSADTDTRVADWVRLFYYAGFFTERVRLWRRGRRPSTDARDAGVSGVEDRPCPE